MSEKPTFNLKTNHEITGDIKLIAEPTEHFNDVIRERVDVLIRRLENFELETIIAAMPTGPLSQLNNIVSAELRKRQP